MAVSGILPDDHYKRVTEKNKKQLSENRDIFGLQTIGDGAAIKKMPLFNVLATTYGYEPATIAVHDTSEHL